MKIASLAAAGLVALTALAPVAGAQTVTRTVTRTHVEERGPAFRHHHARRVCTVERHGHRRVRTCRTVRD